MRRGVGKAGWVLGRARQELKRRLGVSEQLPPGSLLSPGAGPGLPSQVTARERQAGRRRERAGSTGVQSWGWRSGDETAAKALRKCLLVTFKNNLSNSLDV